ncbi:MAG: hypothetical protein IJF59_02205 [Clostridia bacterium]|nr:hypothetical protein [Clostridia bacterium]
MASFIGDLSARYDLPVNQNEALVNTMLKDAGVEKEKPMGLDFTDFLSLMIAQFQNQSIDSTADTTDMLNQMVQMQMIQSLTDMSEALLNLTDASVMSYSASLVGKEVTVAKYDDKGQLQELVGTVTATGTMDGEQVVFLGDEYYKLNEIMAVGRLPEIEKPEEPKGEEPKTEDPATEGTDPEAPETV